MNSAAFQKLTETLIDELQQNVFKNNLIEIDYCDKDFNIIRNVKGNSTAIIPVTALPVPIIDSYEAIASHWVCNRLAGSNVSGAGNQVTNIEWLKKNFYFSFREDSTFYSNFISPASMDKPVFIEGRYKITRSNISLYDLTFDGDSRSKEMHFGIKLNEGSLELISNIPDKDDLVMSFEKVPVQ